MPFTTENGEARGPGVFDELEAARQFGRIVIEPGARGGG